MCWEKSSAKSDDEGLVHLPIGVSQQDIREAALQHVLTQECRFFHNLKVRDNGLKEFRDVDEADLKTGLIQ